jgi:hypothetical protein
MTHTRLNRRLRLCRRRIRAARVFDALAVTLRVPPTKINSMEPKEAQKKSG